VRLPRLSGKTLGDETMVTLVDEVWIDPEGLPGLCLAGPLGDGFRQLQGPGSKFVATIEASSHFEAMTKYNAMLGRGAYATDCESDRAAYPDEWQITQRGGST
jgi:hypothetical protein